MLTTAEQAEVALAGSRSARCFIPQVAGDRPGCCGCGMPATRAALWSWMPVRSGRSPSARPRCFRPASPRYAVSSPPASRWSSSVPMVVARGLVNYDSDELPALLGRTTRDLAAELGAGYDRTVVHRDALVVIESADAGADLV